MPRVGVAAMMVGVGIAWTSLGTPDDAPARPPVSSAPRAVYCSEDDPEEFAPKLTLPHPMDASTRPIDHRLVQLSFRATTQRRPAGRASFLLGPL